MATWQAEIKVTTIGSYFPVTVEAGSVQTARQTIEHIYSPINIRNLRQISSRSGSSSGLDVGGTGALIGLIATIWVFANFAHFILMLGGGAIGAWIGQLVTGQSLDDYSECDEDDDASHIKFLIMLILSLSLGGFGFVKGLEVKKYFETPNDSTVPTEIKKK
jgi:hypothetical protein